jgi:uncharacterized protein YbjT (DUF2867 family)
VIYVNEGFCCWRVLAVRACVRASKPEIVGALIKSEGGSNDFDHRSYGQYRNRTQAQTIHLPGIELVEGDFAEPKTLTPALGNANRLFLLVPSSLEVEQQKRNFVDAAKRSKVKHISKLSRLRADEKAPGRFQRSSQAVFYAPAGNAKVSVVDVRDIASVAARVLKRIGA